uniref:Beta-glucuronidase n=2 Tax=Bombyx mori TaxID=7091 RepID=A0A8R2QY71_BOMMO|nr:beta-glucuronidase isoform X1 [Bombyx mori]
MNLFGSFVRGIPKYNHYGFIFKQMIKPRFAFALLLICIVSVTIAVVPLSSSSNEINQLYKRKLPSNGGALYPRATETRDLRTLDGIWSFRPSPADPEFGYRNGWYAQDLEKTGSVIHMPVPSSYNDVGEDASLRDHVGLVWYDRRFHVPPWWQTAKQRVWVRFSSVHYAAEVFVNGKSVTYHEIGHLPFEVEITDVVNYNTSNLLTVAVDNTLLSDTVPQGYVKQIIDFDKVRQEQTYTFDFFNYAGIHRTVFLYSTPQVYIDDVIVNTDIQGFTGFVVYNVTHKGPTTEDVLCLIQVFDKSDTQVVASNECAGLLEIANARFWWPYLMNPEPGYLYTFRASLISRRGDIIDTYSQKIGIRTVTWTNTTIYLNSKPLYLRGFGMHEDSDLRGKGWDPVLWVKNFNLIKWIGANAFRTSHYPYAEEIYQLADEYGIMIIDECPSGDTDIFTQSLLNKHKQSLTELIRRDKNHPSVIMWSISNEPRSAKQQADAYFAEVVKHVKSMDLSRPVTIAISQYYNTDRAGQHLDVICFNRYNGWYQNTGDLNYIVSKVVEEATEFHRRHNKPVIMTEYGADTVAGLHFIPEYVWSEEYQVALMSEHFKAFDKLRQTGFFAGEFIWNFADFKTAQTITRVGGNRKGIFTRSRQPKASAHHLRTRYLSLAVADGAANIPDPTYYISDNKPTLHEDL